MVSLSILLGLASCVEVDYEWPAMTLVAREGMAVLEIEDDEVLFEGVPFAGTVTIFPIETIIRFLGPGSIVMSSAGHRLSYVFDRRGTMEVSVSDDDGGMTGMSFTVTLGGERVEGELRFIITGGGEEVEFEGRRARLADGAKRIVFTKDGDIEVSDRE